MESHTTQQSWTETPRSEILQFKHDITANQNETISQQRPTDPREPLTRLPKKTTTTTERSRSSSSGRSSMTALKRTTTSASSASSEAAFSTSSTSSTSTLSTLVKKTKQKFFSSKSSDKQTSLPPLASDENKHSTPKPQQDTGTKTKTKAEKKSDYERLGLDARVKFGVPGAKMAIVG